MKLNMKKHVIVLSVLAVALLLFTSCLDSDGVLSAKKSITMPAEIANIPAGSTLFVSVRPNFELLWEQKTDAEVATPYTNDYIEVKDEEYFSINGGAKLGLISDSPFRKGGVTADFLKEQVEAVLEYYLTTEKGVYFFPDAENKKALYSTAPADFDYETWPYAPVLVAGGETLAPTFVLADDPAAADYTLDVYYSFDTSLYQVVEFDQGDGYIKDYWDNENKKNLKQNGDIYLWYTTLVNYKLIDNATGETVCDIRTPQSDGHIKSDSKTSLFGTMFLANTADAAAFLNSYDFEDKAVDMVIDSVQSVIPCLRVLWYCNADDMTIVHPETAAE